MTRREELVHLAVGIIAHVGKPFTCSTSENKNADSAEWVVTYAVAIQRELDRHEAEEATKGTPYR